MSSPTDSNGPPDGPDGLDGWLDTPIEPLLPRPGTYERIVRRARQRRMNRVVTAAASAAAVIAAVAFVPQLPGLVTAQGSHQRPTSTPPVSAPGPQPQVTHSVRVPPEPTIAPGPQIAPAFRPASATFIGLKTGWALGRYAAPCPSGGCTALARTDDTGERWYSVHAPDAGTADADTGISQVRFLNRDDGWVFGPQLWSTHDGGQSWNRVRTGGQRVVSLETTGDRVFAVFAQCTGSGQDWNSGCTSYQLYSAAAAGDSFTAVPGGSGPGTASLVLTSQTGYLLTQNGQSVTVLSGPISGGAPWSAATAAPCGQPPHSAQSPQPPETPTTTHTPQPTQSTGASGQPGPPALLAAASQSDLFLLCAGGTGSDAQRGMVYASSNGGGTWQQRGPAPVAGAAASAAAPGGTLILGTSSGVYVSADGGASWQMSLQQPDGGTGYVGMTDTLQGFAVPGNPGGDAIWFTADGGQSWRRSRI